MVVGLKQLIDNEFLAVSFRRSAFRFLNSEF